jgi:ectoine hydroxylase-related dioxygenase (phytanoyl-CoA dioxygenase family)
MWTCWIALTPCGAEAPGLQWLALPLDRLLLPAQLTPAAVQAAFSCGRLRQPQLRAGEALLFDGRLLHRTHSRAAMSRPRRSLELRFVAAGAPPPRLAGDRLLPLQ